MAQISQKKLKNGWEHRPCWMESWKSKKGKQEAAENLQAAGFPYFSF